MMVHLLPQVLLTMDTSAREPLRMSYVAMHPKPDIMSLGDLDGIVMGYLYNMKSIKHLISLTRGKCLRWELKSITKNAGQLL